ncbi:MAG: hypothetical protein JO316_19825 [Abitibacteriaceae bacterium]|nr:hypothetical protein [Abditibacteriaceae bacterium]
MEGAPNAVTGRAFGVGLLLSCGLAWLNCWIATVYNVHFLGGVQMPFGAVFALLLLIILVNAPLRSASLAVSSKLTCLSPLSAVELVTIYVMLLFAALVSSPGTYNFFILIGPTLFYFASRENRWADLFYAHVPTWFAPGWDGHTYQKQVVDRLFVGGLKVSQIPWHAWGMMLVAWSIFLLLAYAMLFFVALMFRRQWIEHEALAFPLVQLPLQMVEDVGSVSQSPFWSNRSMWLGFALAAGVYFLKGMNAHYPEWPTPPVQDPIGITFTEKPWSAMGSINAELHLGAIGLTYLLTLDVAFSLWFFFLFQKGELIVAEMMGFPAMALSKDTYQGQPTFITFQSLGGWVAVLVLVLWAARHSLLRLVREAVGANRTQEGEPFSPRFVACGFLLSLSALITWCLFAGINVLSVVLFLTIYLTASIVLTRIVIEAGFSFSQLTFSPLEWMTTGLCGSAIIGADAVAKLSFLQAVLMRDTRTHVLPCFLHTMKLAQDMQIEGAALRRLLGAAAAAIVVAHLLTIVVSLRTFYVNGALGGYKFYTMAQGVLTGAAFAIKTQPGVDINNLFWMGLGGLLVVLLTLARSRLVWFPLHPAGFLIAPGYGLKRLWFSFFLGWLIKSLLMKFGGGDTYIRVRPFMMGLVLGNVSAMVFWMIVGFFSGTQIPFWPA